jgi:Spy/CpxP family protein refolding chaperone
MSGGHQIVLGIAMSAVLLGAASSFTWADGRSGCGGGEGHAVGMVRHGLPGHGGRHHGTLHHLLRHPKELGLTDDQVAKLRALALDQDRAQIRAHADVQVAERELRALVWDEKTDLAVIEAKVKESEVLEGKLRFAGIKGKRALFAVLTPEQRDKLKAIREQMRESHRARRMSQWFEQVDREEIAEGVASTLGDESPSVGPGGPAS